MPKYEAEFDIPMGLSPEDLAHFIEGLRAFGYPKIIFRVEGVSKARVAVDVSNELSHWWLRTGKYTDSWFYEKLRAIRGKRAREEF